MKTTGFHLPKGADGAEEVRRGKASEGAPRERGPCPLPQLIVRDTALPLQGGWVRRGITIVVVGSEDAIGSPVIRILGVHWGTEQENARVVAF